MSKEDFYPDLITNWPVSLVMFEKLSLGDEFEKKADSGGDVVRKQKDWQGKPRINFCKTRSKENCALCLYKKRRDQCESPIS